MCLGCTAATEEWTFSGLQPTDPAAGYADEITGDFYYNSTTGQFKTVNTGGAPIGTWASVSNLNQARYGPGGAGLNNTSAVIFGGFPNGPGAQTEVWDGSSWTEVNDMNHGRGFIGGAGTAYNAALAYGGNSATTATDTRTETYNGSNWTEVNDMNHGRGYICLLYTSPSPRDGLLSRMPSSA